MKNRIFILGLDSATFSVIDPLVKKKRLPNFAKIYSEGVRAEMISTYPPRTAPAWVSLMTGQNPGKHGIFDFWDSEFKGYDRISTKLVTSSNYAGQTFFDILSRNEKRVGALFVPMTYPTWAINGEMIAGPPLSPEGGESLSYPSGIYGELGVKHDVHIFPPSIKTLTNPNKTISDLLLMEDARTDVALKLWEAKDYDCFMYVLESIDIIQHRFWRNFKSKEGGEFNDVIPQFYEKVDGIISRILGHLGKNDILMIVSDHGMTSHPKTCFNTNAWLATKGLLSFSKRKAFLSDLLRNTKNLTQKMLPQRHYRELKKKVKGSESRVAKNIRMSERGTSIINWANTTAFRVPMPDPPLEGIMINLQGRQTQGIISDALKEKTTKEIANAVLNIKEPLSGKNIVKTVFFRDDLYNGPMAHKMPDIIIEFVDGYKAAGGLSTDEFTQTPDVQFLRQSGTHAQKGIFMALGSPFTKGKHLNPIHITDFAPMMLYAMNQLVPSIMDGSIHLEGFKEEFVKENELHIGEVEASRDTSQAKLTDEEISQIEEKLKGLGYL